MGFPDMCTVSAVLKLSAKILFSQLCYTFYYNFWSFAKPHLFML